MGGLVELHRPFRILLHAVAMLEALAQQSLGAGMALLGRLGKPRRRLLVIPLQPDPPVVEKPQVALGGGILLIRRLAVQLRRPQLIQFHAAAHLVAQPQFALGGGIALLRGLG